MKETLWFTGIIILLWLIWFFTGGPTEYNSKNNNIFLDKTPISISSKQTDVNLNKKVFIGDVTNAKESNINNEFIELVASRTNTDDINISGWKLRNSLGKEFIITKAVKINYSGKLNTEEDIKVAPGERVIIISGFSPVGTSFKVNKCSGYLEQFQDFTPPLAQNCPNPQEDAKKLSLESSCLTFLSTLPSCNIYTENIPIKLSSACTDYIYNKINYNSCLDIHKNDTDFYSGEWRIFLKENNELWNNTTDLIRLYDINDNLIDSIMY